MSSFKDFLEDELVDHLFGIGTYASPALHIGLYTANPSDSANGTEVTNANAYARTGDQTGTDNWNTSSGGSTTNKLNIDFAQATGNWGTVTAMAISDSGTHGGGNQLMYDDFTGVAINTNDTARFPASTGITVAIT